jgi:GGDEF domain-containing protein
MQHDPFLRSVPLLHLGTGENPVEPFWSRACGARGYHPRPPDPKQVLAELVRLPAEGRGRISESLLTAMDDRAVLTLAGSLMEKDLLKARILNEISLIDSPSLPFPDLVHSLMAVLQTLFDFKAGLLLRVDDHEGELLTFPAAGPERLQRWEELLVRYLRDRCGSAPPERLERTLLGPPSPPVDTEGGGASLYIHPPEDRPVQALLALEGLDPEGLDPDERLLLDTAMRLVHNVVERKLHFLAAQRLSVIDRETEGFSRSFFLGVLEREIDNARRNGYPLVLFSLSLSGRTFGGRPAEEGRLLRAVHQLILKVMRKSDIVVRWEPFTFVFLLSHTTEEKAGIALERIRTHLQGQLEKHPEGSGNVRIASAVLGVDLKADRPPEELVQKALPAAEA